MWGWVRHPLFLAGLVSAALLPLVIRLAPEDPGRTPARPVRLERAEPTATHPAPPDAAAPRGDGLSGTPAPVVEELGGADRLDPAGGPPGVASDFDCVIEPEALVEIGSPVEGLIQAIHVQRSDSVTAGQLLVELDAGVERATVQVAEARSEMAAEVRGREAARDLDHRRKERASTLFDRDAISLEIKDKVDTEARMSEYELQQARERKRLASLELRQAIELLARRTIHSPISGFVVERRMEPGEVVDDQVILTVAQVDPLRVEVILPSALFGSIEVGSWAEVFPELPREETLRARVAVVDRVLDAASGTFGVRLELPNPSQAIPGGLRCRVRFLDGDAQ